MKADLETRIADAFGAELSSKEIDDLLREVTLTVTAANEASRLASERALDPMTRPAEVAAARKEMEDADFRAKRLTIAAEKLGELKVSAVARERSRAARAEFMAAKAERDEIVDELRAVYPELAGKLADLIMRLADNQARVEQANRSIPAGESWLYPAEMIARDAGERWINNIDSFLPKLTDFVRLPMFKRDPNNNHGLLWPPKSRL